VLVATGGVVTGVVTPDPELVCAKAASGPVSGTPNFARTSAALAAREVGGLAVEVAAPGVGVSVGVVPGVVRDVARGATPEDGSEEGSRDAGKVGIEPGLIRGLVPIGGTWGSAGGLVAALEGGAGDAAGAAVDDKAQEASTRLPAFLASISFL